MATLSHSAPVSSNVSTSLPDLLALSPRAGQLKLPNVNIKSHHKGSLLSAFKGRGMELADVRRFQQGDDVRDMNWPMFARTGELHTKLYQEERERPLYLWVDHSSPMQFATQGAFKAVIASRLAALVGWHELGKHNRIGGMIARDNDVESFKATKSRKGFMALLQGMCAENTSGQQPEQPTLSLANKLAHLNQVKQPGAALYLFSDFSGWDQECESLLLRLSQHQDVLLTLVLDPLEIQLPTKGQYAFSNGQQQVRMDMGRNTALKAYYRAIAQRIERMSAMGYYPNIDTTCVLTNDDPIEASYQSLNQIQSSLTIGVQQ